VPDVVLIDRSDGVATVTLNRPDAMNSLSVELKEALLEALRTVSADPAVRAVVLTGAGRAFCVGQDLREHAALLEADDPAPLRTVKEHYNPIALALAELPKPAVAAVNGVAAGAGASLTFACDFRIAAASASFLLAFAGVGLGLDTGASWTLPRLIGSARATALALLAEPVGAEAALEMGLVNAVVDDERVLTAAQTLALRLAAGPSAAYAAIKRAIAHAASTDLAGALEIEDELQVALGQTEDHRNATLAFLHKQKPTFTGR
jgi:2-(1,2-epoxy-1,2-dihydrophenyl)acetyl-CoA isomerase